MSHLVDSREVYNDHCVMLVDESSLVISLFEECDKILILMWSGCGSTEEWCSCKILNGLA